jgi:membrane dipeptidase
MNKRALLKATAIGVGGCVLPMINFGHFQVFAASPERYSARAVDLIRRAVVIDLKHALSLNPATLKSWLTVPGSFGETEWRRFQSTGLTVIQTTLETVDDTLLDYAWHDGFVAAHGDWFRRIDSVAALESIKGTGKLGIIFGSENSTHFKTVDDIDLYYSLGQRVSQLTYNEQNLIGSGATERSNGGLSDFGVSIVERMNQVGMAVDVSHCGERTTLDALEASKRPVLVTHGNPRALNPHHPRTKTDEAIRRLAAGGGVMGIAYLRTFIRDQEPTTIEHALDHFDYVARLVGVEHLAVGSDIDLDGYDDLPREIVAASKAKLKSGYAFREKDDVEGLDHPRRMYDLVEGLIRRGYSNADIELIIGGNARRVLAGIWTV